MGLEYQVFDDVVGPPELLRTWCDFVSPKLQPARVYTKDGSLTTADARIAASCALNAQGNETLLEFQRQLDDMMGIPSDHAEDWQFVRYGVGGKYEGHFDWFAPTVLSKEGAGQRVLTALLYLVAPVRGGSTRFPLLNLSVQPKPGRLLVFHNLDEAGQPNPWTWHEAEPVLEGEKWIATRWYRERPFSRAPRISSKEPEVATAPTAPAV